jgi:hypothetical protein
MHTTTVETRAGSTNGDKHGLDQHVEDVLHRRDKFRRTMQGLWAYLKTPVGILTGNVPPQSSAPALVTFARYLRVSCGVLGLRDRALPRQMDQFTQPIPTSE